MKFTVSCRWIISEKITKYYFVNGFKYRGMLLICFFIGSERWHGKNQILKMAI